MKEWRNKNLPTEIDWENACDLTKFLKCFYDATRRLYGSLYVTANIFFNEVRRIENTLSEWYNSSNVCLCSMAFKMKENFLKYWKSYIKVNKLLIIAVILDPRFKLRYIKFCYSKVHESEKVKEMVDDLMTLMKVVFGYYENLVSSSTLPGIYGDKHDLISENDTGNIEIVGYLSSEFQKHLEEEECKDKNELEKYLEESCERDGPYFQILYWWKENGSRYHVLSLIARDVLAIPVLSVVSESAFSTRGRVLDQF